MSESDITKAEDTNLALFGEERAAKTIELTNTKGHPLQLFTKENEALRDIIYNAKESSDNSEKLINDLKKVREVAIHYAKKGDLLYPLLKVKYGISGPSDVLWTDDDEIRDELSALSTLAGKNQADEKWQQRVNEVFVRIEKMINVEEKVLFPNCAGNFTDDEWIGIYHDQKDYAKCLGVDSDIWEIAENNFRVLQGSFAKNEEEVILAGGHMTVEQLNALLNTIPLEITFVDADDINRFFNEGPKDFKRPGMAIDRDVFSCHPPKVEAKVRRIIEEFRAGTLDEVPIWMDKNGKSMYVKYMAVRDKAHNYLGTLELVQDMEFAKEHFKL